jgi:hypothetical protein
MSPRSTAAGALALLLLPCAATADRVPALGDGTFEALRDRILPSRAEERWREIPWRPSTWEAVVEAAEAEKPVLVWAMNGHPLACT